MFFILVDELEYRLPEKVKRPDFAIIADGDDRFIARKLYLKKLEKNLSILAEIEKEKPKLYALIGINISKRSEVEIKKCTDYDTYSEAKDPLPFLLDIIQSYQLAPTGDPLVNADAAVQAYHTMKQSSGGSELTYLLLTSKL